MYKLEKPLYHGTSTAASLVIEVNNKFHLPIYLCEDREMAIHYAKASTVFAEHVAQEDGFNLIADGYALLTFTSLPDKEGLEIDDYNPEAEPNQFKYTKPIRGMAHCTVETFPLELTESERLRLMCYAIGMRRCN